MTPVDLLSLAKSAATRLKRLVASGLCAANVGSILAATFRDKLPANGLTIDVAHPQISAQTKAMIFWGVYESAERRFVNKYISGHRDVVELGASIGVVSSHIARRLSPTARLIVVEPNPELHDVIRRNIARNAAMASCIVESAAIDYSGQPRLAMSGDSTFTATISPRTEAISFTTHSTTLADLLRRHDVAEFDLVCDIEGAEAQLLEKDGESLRRCVTIVIELHESLLNDGRRLSVSDLKRKLFLLGYALLEQRGAVGVFMRSQERVPA